MSVPYRTFLPQYGVLTVPYHRVTIMHTNCNLLHCPLTQVHQRTKVRSSESGPQRLVVGNPYNTIILFQNKF